MTSVDATLDILGVRRLGPALTILRTKLPKDWPAAIEAITDADERRWADHWLRQQAQLLRYRRAATTARDIPTSRENRDRHLRAQREQRRR